jgi:ADP-ribose pyrophosphatase YjhB (NUDIX family)
MNSVTLARELGAIAQTGLHYSKDQYDKERYTRLRTIAAEILAAQSDLSCDEILAWSKEQFGYATPKVDVRAFILKQNKVLLIREDADDGLWTLPGGWADVNESPSESIVREVEEESGYIIKPIRLLAVFDRERQGHTPPFPYHVYKLFFHCEIVGGSPRRTAESSESAFFDEVELPELSESRVLPCQILAFFGAIREGSIETKYD